METQTTILPTNMSFGESRKTIENHVVICDCCDWRTVVEMVTSDFDYGDWTRIMKKCYSNKRIHYQIVIAVEISQMCGVSPDRILTILMQEFWNYWNWESHITATKREAVYRQCKNCKQQLILPEMGVIVDNKCNENPNSEIIGMI